MQTEKWPVCVNY